MTETTMIRVPREVRRKIERLCHLNYRGVGQQVAYLVDEELRRLGLETKKRTRKAS